MRIELAKDRQIKGTLRKAGETVIVRKDEGERLIAKGLANRIIQEPDNRIVGAPENRGIRRFSGHRVFGR